MNSLIASISLLFFFCAVVVLCCADVVVHLIQGINVFPVHTMVAVLQSVPLLVFNMFFR